MIFMACGFDGAEKFVQGSSKSSISEDSLLRPEISHWSPLVEKWLPETTEVQITWKNIFLLNAGRTDIMEERPEKAVIVFGGDDWNHRLQLEDVRCVAQAGISTCLIIVERSDRGITVRAGTTGPGLDTPIKWFELAEDLRNLRKIVWSLVDSRLSSPIVYGITHDNGIVRMALNSESVDCTFPEKIAGLRLLDVSAGREHVLFLTTEGQIFSVGLSSRGQLGHGNLDTHEEPAYLAAFEDMRIKQISAGGWSSMALNEFGLVFVWGWNSAGALGFPNRGVREQAGFPISDDSSLALETVELLAEPRHLSLPEEIVWISCGERHAGAVSVTGKVFVWGLNQHGQLGLGDRLNRDFPVLLHSLILELPRFSRVFCGEWATVFLLKSDQTKPEAALEKRAVS